MRRIAFLHVLQHLFVSVRSTTIPLQPRVLLQLSRPAQLALPARCTYLWKSREMRPALNSSGKTGCDSRSRQAITITGSRKGSAIHEDQRYTSSDTRVIKRQWRSHLNGNSERWSEFGRKRGE